MITFACRCSHKMTVEDDRAGESLQCPNCGLLVDVPTIDDLPGLREDGSYEINDIPIKQGPSPLRDAPSILRRESTDRRQSLKEFLSLGTTDDDLLELKDEVKPGVPKHPKYDPVTGELIVPLDVRKEPQAAPMMAVPVTLAYEHKAKVSQPSIFAPFVWMFRLPNMIVCGVVSMIFFACGAMVAVGSMLWLLLLFVPPLLAMVVAHFANVVDETGPTGTDEMPAPMRSGNLFDDFVRPFAQVIGSYLLAMSPIFLINLYVKNLHWSAEIGLSIFLHLMIPAILLTMITSGAFNNLLPSRIFSVITASGGHYWIVTFTGYLAILAASVATAFCLKSGFTFHHLLFKGPLSTLRPIWGMPPGTELLIVPLITFAAMYLVHVYAWQLGLLYRLHHDKFDWVWQKHDKSQRTDVQAQLHAHRQKMLEEKAAAARQAMEQRQAAQPKVPVAKPVDPWRH